MPSPSSPGTSVPIPVPAPGGPVLVPVPDPRDLLPSIPGVSAVADLGSAAAATAAWVGNRHNLVRVAWVVVGMALIMGGTFTIARRPATAAIAPVAKTAAKLIK